MSAASVAPYKTDSTATQEARLSQLRNWAGGRGAVADAFSEIFAGSLDGSNLRFLSPSAAHEELTAAQVSPLGPRTADSLARSASARQSATSRQFERDLEARRSALSDQPRVSDELAAAQQREAERNGAAAHSAVGAPPGAPQPPAHAAPQHPAGMQQRPDANAARSSENRAASQSSNGNANSSGAGANDGGRGPQQSTANGNAVSAQAQAASAGAGGSAASAAAGRGGSAAPITAAPSASPSPATGNTQNNSLNFAEALQSARGAKQSAQAKATRGANLADRLSSADSKAFLQGVSRGLFATVRQNGGSLTMRLHPASLGQLKIHMSIQGNAVTADITATTEQAQQMLSEHLGALRAALESKGLTVTQINVTQAPQGVAAQQAQHAGQQGAEQQGSTPHDSQGAGQDADRGESGDSGDASGGSDRSERQGGGSFTWHIPVPGASAERTETIDGYVVSALNVVA